MVVMDSWGVIRCIIETEEDVAWETRRLAERIHRLLNPELFPEEPPTPAVQPVDSLHPLDAYPVDRPRRIGVPGPPVEPRPSPPGETLSYSVPTSPPPRYRMIALPELTRPTRATRLANLVSVPEEPTPSEPEPMNHSGQNVTQARRPNFDFDSDRSS